MRAFARPPAPRDSFRANVRRHSRTDERGRRDDPKAISKSLTIGLRSLQLDQSEAVLLLLLLVLLRRLPRLLGLAGLLSVVFGVLIAYRPVSGLVALVWLIGIYAIVFGILYIVGYFQTRSLASS